MDEDETVGYTISFYHQWDYHTDEDTIDFREKKENDSIHMYVLYSVVLPKHINRSLDEKLLEVRGCSFTLFKTQILFIMTNRWLNTIQQMDQLIYQLKLMCAIIIL